MEKSPYDKLSKKFADAIREYEEQHPTHRVDVRMSVAIPKEGGGHTAITYSDFLSSNTVEEDIKFLSDDAFRPDEPPERLQDDIWAIYNAGNVESAVYLAERVVGAYPANAKAHQWLGEIYCSGGSKEKGLQTLEEALRLAESEAWLSRHDLSTAIEIRTALGQLYIFEDQPEVGHEHLNTALHMAQDAGLEEKTSFVTSIVEQYKQ